MEQKKYPFSISCILLFAYLLLLPLSLIIYSVCGGFGLPSLWDMLTLLNQTTLVYLGLAVVLLFRKPGLPTAVFTLIGAFLQISPIIYHLWKIFFGGATISGALTLGSCLCLGTAFGFLTFFAVCLSLKPQVVAPIKVLWFVPLLATAVSFCLCLAEQIFSLTLATAFDSIPFLLNLFLLLLLNLATALLGVWYKGCVKEN